MDRLKIHGFIKKIQTSEERTKRRYLYAASSVSMIIVVVLWIFYLNLTLPAATNGTTASSTTNFTSQTYQVQRENQNSFLETLGRGMSTIGNSTREGFLNLTGRISGWWSDLSRGIENFLQKTNTFNIEKNSAPDVTSTPGSSTPTLENIPPTPLP